MLKKLKFLLGVMVVAVLFVGVFTLVKTQTASAEAQAIVTVADVQYAATVKLGSSGQAALIWQRFLNGYSTTAQLVEDGKFGPLSTVQAKAWQASKGLVADGVMGALSRAAAMAQIASGVPASAFPAGCTSAVGYSSVTGLACAPTALPAGCTAGALFSSTTGASCSVSVSLPAGCSSTAGYSSTTGAKCDGGSVSTNTGPLAGGAGDATMTPYTTSEKSSIVEGDSNIKVLGFRVEATDSDIALQNVKVTIKNTDVTNPVSSYRIDRYLDSVDIYQGSTKVGSANVADFTKDSANLYSKSIALSNAVVRNGDKDPFYVVFNAASTIDSDNDTAKLTVAVDSYRFQDATGVIMTNDPLNPVQNIVSINTASDTLTLTTSSNNPSDSTVKVDESNTTDEVPALVFKLKAGSSSSDITLDTLPITVAIKGAGAGAEFLFSTKVIDSIIVKIGSKTITADETHTVISNDGTTTKALYTADFSGEGVVIAAGDTIEAKVYITFAEQGGSGSGKNYTDGSTVVTASITGTAITAESVNNDTISPTSGLSTGAKLTLSTTAANVTTSTPTSNTNNDSTVGTFSFTFKVTADNGAVNLLADATDLAYEILGPAGQTATHNAAVTKISGTAAFDGTTYTVADGDNATFSLDVTITPADAGDNGVYRVHLTTVAGNAVDLTAGPETLAHL